MSRFVIIVFFLTCYSSRVSAQINLLGDNAPKENILDGDFNKVLGGWRAAKQSPYWKTRVVKGVGKMGVTEGKLFSNVEEGIAESVILNANSAYLVPKKGDVLDWSFGADLEYISKGRITVSLVFGTYERVLAKKIKLRGSDKIVEHFRGTYTITNEDVKQGLPFVRVTFYSSRDIKLFLDYINVSVRNTASFKPKIKGEVVQKGIKISWKANGQYLKHTIYRCQNGQKGYVKIGETQENYFLDNQLIHGVDYTYVVTGVGKTGSESVGSNKIRLTKKDTVAPAAPTNLKAVSYDAEVMISWDKSKDRDVEYYTVFRGDNKGGKVQEIAHKLTRNRFLDFTPTKEVENVYMVYAYDYSGNRSQVSESIKTKVKMVKGASFSDLILPMPIHKKIRTKLWGGENVLPRDSDNGIEDRAWSYWGGRPVKGKDGKYHMNVTRWPANDIKGHWEWPHSTVAYTVSDKPTGPYKVKRDLVYKFQKGLGHNPDVILLNNGRYLLYSLVNWKATLFISDTMSGPWERLGVMKIDENTSLESPKLFYRFYRNLSGVQMDDGRFLFVTKAGGMMVSKGTNPLGPYKVITGPLQGSKVIPEQYRNSNFEDPVLWKDEVQYHMMINAFLDYRAIYLRSSDGIHWKFNSGTAYTPNNTTYTDGTKTSWYKLERPHVLTDKYGRATHLSLAAIDVPKKDDLANDNHSSKNLIIPLVVSKRIKMLNRNRVDRTTKEIKVLIQSEEGFNAQKDIAIKSLRFGATEVVDYGRGSKVIRSVNKGKDLLVVFDGVGNGITKDNFVCKMIGKDRKGKLIIGYSKLFKSLK
ncbi:hypothetical protein [Wenyingzhuangia sp. IMCC45574]